MNLGFVTNSGGYSGLKSGTSPQFTLYSGPGLHGPCTLGLSFLDTPHAPRLISKVLRSSGERNGRILQTVTRAHNYNVCNCNK